MRKGEHPVQCVYHQSSTATLDFELRLQWCMTLFSILDGVLIDYTSSSLPKMRKHDGRLEALEEKVEILASWFNDLRMSCGLEVARDSRYFEAISSSQYVEGDPSSTTLVSGMQEQAYPQYSMQVLESYPGDAAPPGDMENME